MSALDYSYPSLTVDGPPAQRSPTGGDFCRSIVIREDCTAWYNNFFLIPHEPFRMYLEWIDFYVINNVEGSSASPFDPVRFPWKVNNWWRWYNRYYSSVVHHHHEVEEKVVMPAVLKAQIGIPEESMDEHVHLIKTMDDLQGCEREWRSICNSQANPEQKSKQLVQWCSKFKACLKSHVDLMRKHLADEERIFSPIMKEKFHEKGKRAIESQIVRNSTLSGSRAFLPAIIACLHDWGGEEFKSVFMKALPPPIRMLATGSWKREYEEVNLKLMQSLKLDEEPVYHN